MSNRPMLSSSFLDWIQHVVAIIFKQRKISPLLQNQHFRNNGKPVQSGVTKAFQMEKGRPACTKPGYLCSGKASDPLFNFEFIVKEESLLKGWLPVYGVTHNRYFQNFVTLGTLR